MLRLPSHRSDDDESLAKRRRVLALQPPWVTDGDEYDMSNLEDVQDEDEDTLMQHGHNNGDDGHNNEGHNAEGNDGHNDEGHNDAGNDDGHNAEGHNDEGNDEGHNAGEMPFMMPWFRRPNNDTMDTMDPVDWDFYYEHGHATKCYWDSTDVWYLHEGWGWWSPTTGWWTDPAESG
jgi:hypothetical protein